MEVAAVERHPLLEAALPVEAEMLPVWSEQTTVFGDGLKNFMSTTFSLVGDVRNPQQTLHRDIFVNNSEVLGIEFDQFTSKEIFFDHNRHPLLSVTYDPAGLPQVCIFSFYRNFRPLVIMVFHTFLFYASLNFRFFLACFVFCFLFQGFYCCFVYYTTLNIFYSASTPQFLLSSIYTRFSSPSYFNSSLNILQKQFPLAFHCFFSTQ